MADRIIKAVLRGDVSGFVASMRVAQKSVVDTSRTLTAAGKQGDQYRKGLSAIGTTAGKVGLAAAVGLGAIVVASADFDAAMSRVDAATHETAANMELLRAAAIKAGADTVFSATEAADAVTALSKAGVSTKDILAGGLDAALTLASAGELDVATAADIAATALNQFGLGGESATHVADLLAAGAGKAQGEVTDMAAALKYVGPVAHQMGVSIEETTGSIALLASQGIIGEQAGTSLRGMLTSLTSPSKLAASTMDALGISLYDAQGQFVGLSGIAGQLQSALGGLTAQERDQALGRIFGNEQITAARILYAGGAEAVKKWTKAVDDQGFAADTAARKMDNLKGDAEQLGGSLQTLFITSGDGAQGPLRKLVQGLTAVTNAINDLPAPLKNVTTGLLAVTAVTGGALWFGSKVVQGIVKTRVALEALGVEAVLTRRRIALAGAAGATAAVGLGTLLDSLSILDSRSRSSAAADATVKTFEDLQDALSSSNVGKYAEGLKIDMARLTDELLTTGTSSEYVQDTLDRLAKSSHGVGAMFNAFGSVLPFYTANADKAYDASHDLRNIIEASGDVLGSMAQTTVTLADGTKYVGTAAEASAAQIQSLTKSMQDQRKAALGAFDAETQYREALKAAEEQGKKSNAGIRGDSDAALKNRDAISNLAAAWNNQSAAVKNNRDRFRDAKRAFIETAHAMGVPIGQAQRLARQLLEIPKAKVVKVTADTDQARSLIDQLLRPRTLKVKVAAYGAGLGVLKPEYGGGGGRGMNNDATTDHDGNPRTGNWMASGGLVRGPGGPRDDLIPARLSNLEYVMPADSVAYYGVGTFDAMRAKRFAAGGLVGGRDGGLGGYIRNDLDLKFPKTLKQWEQALKASTKSVKDWTATHDDLVNKRDSLRSTVADAFRPAALSSDRPSNWMWMSEGARRQSLINDPTKQLNASTASAEEYEKLLRTLTGKGLDGAAFESLAASGDLERVRAYAGASSGQINAFEAAFNKNQAVTGHLGKYAGDVVYSKQIAESNKHLQTGNHYLAQIDHRVDGLEKAIRQAASKIARGRDRDRSNNARDLRIGG